MSRSKGRPGADTSSATGIDALIPDSFNPEVKNAIAAAYESTLRVLGLTGRGDLITEIVARKIIEIAQTGERDPERIKSLVISGLGLDN